MMDVSQNNFPFPYEIHDLDAKTSSSLSELYEFQSSFVLVGPKSYFMPKSYESIASSLYNAETHHDQVFVGGLPRSGTTWVQEMIWLIMHDLDYEACNSTSMEKKFIFLEMKSIVREKLFHKLIEDNKGNEEHLEKVKILCQPTELKIQHSKWLKTHIPLSMLPSKLLDTSKMVYVARDPRDVMVSRYHLAKDGFNKFTKDLKTFWKHFINGTIEYCPYFEHVKEAWAQRDNPNLLFLFYEDMLTDRLSTLRRVADFFNKSYTDEELSYLRDYLEIDNLRDKKNYNRALFKEIGLLKPDAKFIREGKSGGWRQHFDEEMCREAEQWIADNLRGTDLRFPSVKVNI